MTLKQGISLNNSNETYIESLTLASNAKIFSSIIQKGLVGVYNKQQTKDSKGHIVYLITMCHLCWRIRPG